MKFLFFSFLVGTILSSSLFAQKLDCEIIRENGKFLEYLKPQVGNFIKIDLEKKVIDRIEFDGRNEEMASVISSRELKKIEDNKEEITYKSKYSKVKLQIIRSEGLTYGYIEVNYEQQIGTIALMCSEN